MKKVTILLLFFITSYLADAQLIYPDSQTDGKYVTVNGAKLWVVTLGKGEPIIFISGGTGGAHAGLRRFDSLLYV